MTFMVNQNIAYHVRFSFVANYVGCASYQPDSVLHENLASLKSSESHLLEAHNVPTITLVGNLLAFLTSNPLIANEHSDARLDLETLCSRKLHECSNVRKEALRACGGSCHE